MVAVESDSGIVESRAKRCLMRLVASISVVVTFTACGDDKQGKVTIINDPDASGDTLTGPCSEGDRACEGQTPATCVDGAWVLDENACVGAMPWCLDGACVACAPGAVGCGANTPRVCAEDGSWTYAEPCPEGEPLCLDGACVQCSPGQQRCHPAGTGVQRCDDAGQWVTEEACDFGCSDARCGGVCVPGQGRCDLAVPSTCDTTGTWVPGNACAGTAPLCLDGACVECSPLSVDCAGADARVCSTNGVWEVRETCEFACIDGVCGGECVPDTVGCDGRVPRTCNALGQWVDAVAECAYGCEAGECVGECRGGTLRCFGDAPATCGEDLIWETGSLCPQPTPDCHIGACRCAPEKTLCAGDTLCINLQNDPKNCGACGRDCLGGLCENGACRPIVLASGQSNPVGLLVDGGRVYWSNFGGGLIGAGSIRSIPTSGGVIATVASEISAPTHLAASVQDLFWTTGAAGNVQATPKAGGNIVNLATGMSGPFGIAFGGGSVFFGTTTNPGSIYKVSPTGGTPTVVSVAQTALGMAVDGDWLYWTNGAFGNPNSTVMRWALDGQTPAEVFAANQTRPTAITFDDTHVYWTVWQGNGADAIRRCPKTGCAGDPQTVVSGLQLGGGSNATCIAVDATHLYWAGQGTSTVHRIPKGGGTPVILATNQPAANCVQQDATAIYWTNFNGGNVMKLAK